VSVRLTSLRNRLTVAMLFVFGVALVLASDRPVEWQRRLAALTRFGPDLIHDPYQDLLVLVPMGFGTIGLIWLVSGWSLRHLASASRQAARISPCNPDARISTGGLPEELRPLVDAVNGALDRLADAYEGERRFVANAAHELRTPLAVLNLRLQRAKLDGRMDWPAIEADMGQLSRLVAQLLDLARKEHNRRVQLSADARFDLSRIAREGAAAVVPAVEAAGRTLEVELPMALPIQGRPDDLRDAIRNLLDNALVHGRGTIRLTGGFDVEGGAQRAWISVEDEGEGVRDELREQMFRRFRKGSPDSPGHGLGLAIVEEVARGHGGWVGFLPGRGCRIRLALPACTSPTQSGEQPVHDDQDGAIRGPAALELGRSGAAGQSPA
jgi:signal transduction histidine kinase